MAQSIDEVRRKLWEAIKEVRERGFIVLNARIARTTGQKRGGYADQNELCLIGAVVVAHKISSPCFAGVGLAFDVDPYEIIRLESGFEGWDDIGDTGPYFDLGREIGAQLEAEAGVS